jgi:hypothetical protein
MGIFTAHVKAKSDTENIRGLNVAAVKLTTVQVTELPLKHMIRQTLFCFAKPGLTEDLHSAYGRILSNMLHVR